ncbi:MAG: fumarylacetoacetate hydrolase family protein [Rhodospirillaceae bacterium]|nr:fumarylacetoacetate hydrolase family protein [Rhodospirillaceae bacterium]
MRIVAFKRKDGPGLAVRRGDDLIDLAVAAPKLPRELAALLAAKGALQAAKDAAKSAKAKALVSGKVTYLPTVMAAPKIICVGLNYVDHAAESPYKNAPTYPVLFNRFNSTLVGHNAPLIRPLCSEQFDYEGELVAVIGKRGRHISKEKALSFVAGYSVFNDASVRDYQFKSTQWLMGKNFDGTGGFGPDFVTKDELPAGATGLQLTTRLNGQTMQSANTRDMIFDIATLVATASEGITLEPGDVIVAGTPAGVGFARKPPVWMKAGDVCEVEIEGVGVLSNPIKDEK